MTQGRISFNPREVTGFFTVGLYEGTELVWVDVVRYLTEIFKLTSLRRLPSFEDDKEYEMVVFGRYDTKLEARNALYGLIGSATPRYNKAAGRQERTIVCNETGEEFSNAAELMRVKGLNANSIYPHLRGDKGHATVKGLTYSYKISASAAERACNLGFQSALDSSFTPDAREVARLQSVLGKTEYDRLFNVGVIKAMDSEWKN